MTTTAFSACVGAGLQILWAGGVMNWTDYVLLGVGTACFALGAGVQNQIAEVLDQRDAHLLQQLHVPFSIWPSTKSGLRVRLIVQMSHDAKMARTVKRPLVTGAVSVPTAHVVS